MKRFILEIDDKCMSEERFNSLVEELQDKIADYVEGNFYFDEQ